MASNYCFSGARWPSEKERRSLNPEVLGSNLGQVRLPHIALVSQGRF